MMRLLHMSARWLSWKILLFLILLYKRPGFKSCLHYDLWSWWIIGGCCLCSSQTTCIWVAEVRSMVGPTIYWYQRLILGILKPKCRAFSLCISIWRFSLSLLFLDVQYQWFSLNRELNSLIQFENMLLLTGDAWNVGMKLPVNVLEKLSRMLWVVWML